MDYKNLVERLRDEPKDSRKAVLSIYDLCIDAAYAIEILLDKLKYAEGERDVVTKHMIELEKQNADLHQIADKQATMNVTLTNKVLQLEKELNETRLELKQVESVREKELANYQQVTKALHDKAFNEPSQEESMTCPFCGGKMVGLRSKCNGHFHAVCEKCGARVME